MPELPEVETVRRTLKNFILDKKIIGVDVYHQNIIEDDVTKFTQSVINQRIKDIDRIGKFLIFKLDNIAFVSHLRMEGKYNIVSTTTELSKHDHVVFHLDDGHDLRYNDTRKFGKMKLVDLNDYALQLPLSKLGKEPSMANVEEVYQKLHRTSMPIKHVILDQSIIAGIGNIYANEICFEMRIDPHTPSNKLSKKRVQELIDVATITLDNAIKQGGTTIHSFDSNGITGLFQVSLKAHLQKKCSVCGGDITKEAIKGRGTYYCKKCQKRRS